MAVIPALVAPDVEWAVLLQLLASVAFDSMIPNDALAFMGFADSGRTAQQASAAVLQNFVIWYAMGSTIGGILFEFSGWRGMAVFHFFIQVVQVVLFATDPIVIREIRQTRCMRWCFDSRVASDTVDLVSVVPAPDSKGATFWAPPEAMILEDVDLDERARPPFLAEREAPKAEVPFLVVPTSPGSVSNALPGQVHAQEVEEVPTSLRTTSCGSKLAPSNIPELLMSSDDSDLRSSIVSFADQREVVELEAEVENAESKPRIPRDTILPAVLIGLVGFNQVYSYQTEFSTFAIYFKEVHGWDNAVWSALGQTAGDIIAAGLLTLWKSSSSEMSFGTSSYASFLVHALRKPYHISVLILSWVLLDICMTLPSLPFAFASQILMGSAYVFGQQMCTSMNVFFSLGDSAVYLQLQVIRQAFESVGGSLAAFFSLYLYEKVSPESSFWVSASVSALLLVFYTAGFCLRAGFGKELEELEELRAQKRGITRKKSWRAVVVVPETNPEPA